MIKRFLLPVLAVLLAACGTTNAAAPAPNAAAAKPGAVTVEVVYLNHPPLRPVLAEVDQLLAKYGDRVSSTPMKVQRLPRPKD
jgi:Skp family chaperone for outer membrane proteins